MSATISTKPYLLRAMYEWCTDSGYTPYIAVKVQGQPQLRVPMEFVDSDGEIIFDISFNATQGLAIDNKGITFTARFSGVARQVYVPVGAVSAIYSGETNQGMAFEVVTEIIASHEASPPPKSEKPAVSLAVTNTDTPPTSDDTTPKPKRKKPGLTIIK